MKKKLALILAMIMMATMLGACGSKPTIVGKWEASVSFKDVLADEMMDSMGMEGMEDYFDFDKLPELGILLEFTKDGDCSLALDEDSTEEFIDEMVEVMMDGMLVMIEDMVEAQGMTMDEYYEATGMTEEEFIETAKSELDKEELKATLADTATEVVYEEKDGKIFFGKEGEDEISEDEYWVYELDGDKLKVTEMASADEEEAVLAEEMLPITFERK